MPTDNDNYMEEEDDEGDDDERTWNMLSVQWGIRDLLC